MSLSSSVYTTRADPVLDTFVILAVYSTCYDQYFFGVAGIHRVCQFHAHINECQGVMEHSYTVMIPALKDP